MNLHAADTHRYPVECLCRLLGVSKQAYYKRSEERVLLRVAQEELALDFIREVRLLDPGIGGEKLWYMYRMRFKDNHPMGRDRFASVIDKYGYKVRRRRRKPRTTDSRHGLPLYPNLAKRLIPSLPNQLWVSDITYLPIWLDEHRYIFCYLSIVLDAYTEEVIGWAVGMSLETAYPLQALGMALRRLEGIPKKRINLIHHSDRGCQYASAEYVRRLRRRGISISMTECGDPKENAKAERINNTIKNELLKDVRFTSLDEVVATLALRLQFYNEQRPHMSIDMMTPREAAACSGEIRKHWVSYREKYIREEDNAANPCR